MGTNYTSKNRALETTLREKKLFPNTSAPWQQKILHGLLTRIDSPEDAICLDAACGIGNNIPTLRKKFKKIIAFDRSSDAVEFARARYGEHGEYTTDDVSYSVSQLEHSSQESNSFDCVVCTEALEHVVDVSGVIRELFRVTKPGGYVILSFQNHFNLSALLKVFFERVFKRNWDVWGTHGHEEGYESYLTCFKVKKIISQEGFTTIQEFGADYINAWLSWLPFFYKNYRILDRYPLLFLGKVPLIKYLGMDYFLLLKKP